MNDDDQKRPKRWPHRIVLPVILWVSVAAIFLADLQTQLGHALPVIYVIPVFLALRHGTRVVVAPLLAAVVILTIAGFFLSPPSAQVSPGLVNRSLTLLCILAAAILAVRERRLGEKLTSLNATLEAQVSARTLALEEAVAELERSNQQLDEFAYVASHDLKAPLRDVQHLASWLQEELGEHLTGDPARWMQTLTQRVRRMERLLEDLLHYSRAQRIVGEPVHLELRDAVEEAVQVAGIPPQFEVELAGPSVDLLSPRAPLELVLRNLLSNAVKHHDRDHGHIDVRWRELGDQVCIDIEDDGPGIPPHLTQKAFGIFQTLKPRDELDTSGIGLAVVKKITEVVGGSVTVDDEEGRGTCFTLTWPRYWRRGTAA